MEEDHFPYDERMKKPYVLLVNPQHTRAAAYNHGHRLMDEEASAALLAWGLKHRTLEAAWDDEKDRLYPRPRPPWVPGGSLKGWTLLWLRNGQTSAEALRATPDR